MKPHNPNDLVDGLALAVRHSSGRTKFTMVTFNARQAADLISRLMSRHPDLDHSFELELMILEDQK